MIDRLKDKLNQIEQVETRPQGFLKQVSASITLDYIKEIELWLKELSNEYHHTNGIYAVKTSTEE